jgi:hypothetical protein
MNVKLFRDDDRPRLFPYLNYWHDRRGFGARFVTVGWWRWHAVVTLGG